MMTLDEFRATRVHSEDLRTDVPEYVYGDDPKQTGWIYAGRLVIEDVQPHWPQLTRQAGSYYLVLGNEEHLSHDLSWLEEILYDYAKRDGALGN